MNSRMRILILVPLTIFLIILVVCTTKRALILEKVFVKPDINFKKYTRLAILEFSPNPQIKKNKKFNDLVEDELHKKRYDVVCMDEFNCVLEEYGYSSEDLFEPQVSNKIIERLNITAIIKGTIHKYELEEEKDYMPPIIKEHGTVHIYEISYVCNISFRIEMIEVQTRKEI